VATVPIGGEIDLTTVTGMGDLVRGRLMTGGLNSAQLMPVDDWCDSIPQMTCWPVLIDVDRLLKATANCLITGGRSIVMTD